MELRVLAISAATGRVGYVYFENGELADFALSHTASKSPKHASKYAKNWIEMLRPEVVITEKITKRSWKSKNTHALIRAMAREASKHELHDVSVARQQHFPNKYVEADVYTKRFPDLLRVLPRKPKIWQKEPPNTTYFEAIALALPVIDAPEAD